MMSVKVVCDFGYWEPFRFIMKGETAGQTVTPRKALQELLTQKGLAAWMDTEGKTLHITDAELSLAFLVNWFGQYDAELRVVDAALQRPHAYLKGDAVLPHLGWIPDFFRIRTLAQVLATRARMQLLLDHPEAAARELATLRRLMNIGNEAQPTIVWAMIRAAFGGLYLSVIQEGLTEGLWPEPQLARLQEQLGDLDWMAAYLRAVRGERAAWIQVLEKYTSRQLAHWYYMGGETPAWYEWNKLDIFYHAIPRGWLCQNLVKASPFYQAYIDSYDPKKGQFDLDQASEVWATVQEKLKRQYPYNFFIRMILPNMAKSMIGIARNQCRIKAALIACALERHRLATGNYPESLGALAPRFLPSLPNDPMSGKPFQYRRTPEGSYFLWSVGEHGIANPVKALEPVKGQPSPDSAWVWAGPKTK